RHGGVAVRAQEVVPAEREELVKLGVKPPSRHVPQLFDLFPGRTISFILFDEWETHLDDCRSEMFESPARGFPQFKDRLPDRDGTRRIAAEIHRRDSEPHARESSRRVKVQVRTGAMLT